MQRGISRTGMSEAVSLQVVTLNKPHVTYGTSKWLLPWVRGKGAQEKAKSLKFNRFLAKIFNQEKK